MVKLQMLTIFPSFRCSKVSVLLFGLQPFVWSPERELCEGKEKIRGKFLMYKFFAKNKKEINEIYGLGTHHVVQEMSPNMLYRQ